MAKRVVILGGGESGVGAALLAHQQKYDVFLSDRGSIKEHFKKELENKGIPYEEGQHTEIKIFNADEVVKSPGIPERVPIVQVLLKKGVPVISEIEFAARFSNGKIIGITGSNGKTTTTILLGHLLQECGLNVGVGGNIGTSFARILTQGKYDYYVLELSSFQLDGIVDFKPDIALLLNVTPDHMDRYEFSMSKYVASKFRIGMNQQVGDYFLYNSMDPYSKALIKEMNTGAKKIALDKSHIHNRELTTRKGHYDLRKTALKGIHNAMNALFAVVAAELCGIESAKIQEALETSKAVEHRLEPVAEINGVAYINDSKATNIDAAKFGLMAIEKPIVWIVGGQDKGNEYEVLWPLVKTKVKAIVCLGLNNEKILDTFENFEGPIVETDTAEEAVNMATDLAEEGTTILLSPACASFDLFENYEDRGRKFKEAVEKLKETT